MITMQHKKAPAVIFRLVLNVHYLKHLSLAYIKFKIDTWRWWRVAPFVPIPCMVMIAMIVSAFVATRKKQYYSDTSKKGQK